MFSGTHTTILVVLALAATLVLPASVVGAASTTATVDAHQEATPGVLDEGEVAQENNTTTTTTGPPSSSEVGFGILNADRGEIGRAHV